MHYIRILKPPRLLLAPSPPGLTAKITITTDLGESFLLSNISLVVELEYEDGRSVLGDGKGQEHMWRGRDGMRSLEITVPVRAFKSTRKLGGDKVRMLVRPKGAKHTVDSFAKVLDDLRSEEGGIVTVRSMAIDINPGAKGNKLGVGMAERVFSTCTRDRIRIWEETGESIARHIWDAGLVLSSYLTSLSDTYSSTLPKMPVLQRLLQKEALQVLELGAGCGIVGISLATSFPHISRVLLTDLLEATEIIEKNLSPSALPLSTSIRLANQVLDWSSPVPSNVSATKWDLVLVADCTYNPDVVPDLVQTLKRLAEGNEDVLVLLAMKMRHESEMVFFDLMGESGFTVKEKCKIPLPVLGGEGEEIEIFGFGYQQ